MQQRGMAVACDLIESHGAVGRLTENRVKLRTGFKGGIKKQQHSPLVFRLAELAAFSAQS